MVLPRILLAAWVLLLSSEARAYSISSAFGPPCHEHLTIEALRSVRERFDTARVLRTTKDEHALIEDLTFAMPNDLDDLAGATLLLGVRDNDVKGRHTVDLAHLALIHGAPDGQREHCLRSLGQVEPYGSEEALQDCRGFIRERFEQALDGLDDAGYPDVDKRMKLPIYLALRHRVTPELPTFYARMGQAIHTVQDSFTHTYRTADGMRVTVVTDWLHAVDGKLKESRHGPPHRGELDECDDLEEDSLRGLRRQLALQATTELLELGLDPVRDRAQKLLALDEFLDRYLSYEPGCTADNGWCDAPESRYEDELTPFDCALADPRHDGGVWLLLALMLWRWRKLQRARLLLALLSAGVCNLTGVARAEEAPEKSQVTLVRETRKLADRDSKDIFYGGYAGASGSVDHGALAFALGGRMRFRRNWIFGVDAEWNPWISDPRVFANADHVRAGCFNGYLTAIFRLPLARESFNLRATLQAGVSTMVMDLYGAPRGSTGVFAAIAPLGLEWKMARVPYLVISPLGVALPAPQLRGVPFAYLQYRFTIGVELYGRGR